MQSFAPTSQKSVRFGLIAGNSSVYIAAVPTICFLTGCETPKDRWPSGLRRTPGTRVYVKAYRGFESLPVRHFPCVHTEDIGRSLSPRHKREAAASGRRTALSYASIRHRSPQTDAGSLPGSPNHCDAARATSSGLGAVSPAQATTPSGRTSRALKPSRSLASLAI